MTGEQRNRRAPAGPADAAHGTAGTDRADTGDADTGDADTGDQVGERQVPFFCPYCGEEELRPSGARPGDWECRSCARGFHLRFTGVRQPEARQPEARP